MHSSDQQSSDKEATYKPLSYFTAKSRAGGSKGDCTKDFFICDFEEINNAEKCQFSLSSAKVGELEVEREEELTDLLQTNNNILFFGQGSKIKLLERLASSYHQHGLNVLIVRGYMASVNERTILTELKEFLEELVGSRSEKVKGTEEHFKYLKELIQDRNVARVLLVIHSIDGPHLMSVEGQEFIGKICSLPKMQVVGSFDNIGLPYRWSHHLMSTCRWIFYHVTTQENYTRELKNRLPRNAKRQRVEDSLKYIWKSLTNNQKDILKIIAKQELTILQRKATRRFNLHQLLEKCRDNMVLSNEVQLRDNLIEIMDHKVVLEVMGKAEGGRSRKQYMMSYDRKVLENIVEGFYERKDL